MSELAATLLRAYGGWISDQNHWITRHNVAEAPGDQEHALAQMACVDAELLNACRRAFASLGVAPDDGVYLDEDGEPVLRLHTFVAILEHLAEEAQ